MWWHPPTGRGCFLSSAKGEAPGLIPRAVSGPQAVTGRSGRTARPGTGGRLGAHAREQWEGGPIRRFTAAAVLRTERISVLSQPNSGVEDPTRAGEEARAGGGAERRRDPLGPGLELQPQLCRPCALVPAACGALAPRPWFSWRVGAALAGLVDPRLHAKSWPAQSQHGNGQVRLSWARPLRVLAAPESGAPWLPDLGPGCWR